MAEMPKSGRIGRADPRMCRGASGVKWAILKGYYKGPKKDKPRTKLGPSPKGKRKNRDEKDMVDAIKTVMEKKLGIREAALHFRIPKSKLHRLLSKQTDSENDSDFSVSSGESDLPTPPPNFDTR
uniref:HTH psq-type domain-containing protein n=1 Tax=Rhodnius prolixus TaxID=13249 RepID=T1I7G3_RHOPR